MSKDLGMSSSNKIINEDDQEVAFGKRNVRAACPKGQAGIQGFFFFKPW